MGGPSRARSPSTGANSKQMDMMTEQVTALTQQLQKGTISQEVYTKLVMVATERAKSSPEKQSLGPRKLVPKQGKSRRNMLKNVRRKLFDGGRRSRGDSMASRMSSRVERGDEKGQKLTEDQLFKLLQNRAKGKVQWKPVHLILYTKGVQYTLLNSRGAPKGNPVWISFNEDSFVNETKKETRTAALRTIATENEFETDFDDGMSKATRESKESKPFQFILSDLKSKHYFATDSESKRNVWMNLIDRAIHKDKKAVIEVTTEMQNAKNLYAENAKRNLRKSIRRGQFTFNEEDLEKHHQGIDLAASKRAENDMAQLLAAKQIRKAQEATQNMKLELEQWKQRHGNLEVALKEKEQELADLQELLVKAREEALQRRKQNEADMERIASQIKKKERMSVMPGSRPEASEEIEKLRAQLKALQSALNVDLDALDWDGTLEQAEERMRECLKLMMAGEDVDKAQKEFDQWDQIIRNHADHKIREEKKWASWEAENLEKNLRAIEEMKRYVPREFRDGAGPEKLKEITGQSEQICKRIAKNKVFKFLWMSKDEIAKIHQADLLNSYACSGLDIREMRAVYGSLPEEFQNDNGNTKAQYRNNIRNRLKELTDKEEKGELRGNDELNSAYRGKDYTPARPVAPRPQGAKRVVKVSNKLLEKQNALASIFGPQGGGPKRPPMSARGLSAGAAPDEEALDPSDPKYKKYFTLQKMRKLSDDQVQLMMTNDGLDGKIWPKLKAIKENGGSEPVSGGSVSSGGDNPLLAAIKAKGETSSSPSNGNPLLSAIQGRGKAQPEPIKKAPADPSDPKWTPFMRMQRAGLPDVAIEQKLLEKGIDVAEWNQVRKIQRVKSLPAAQTDTVEVLDIAEAAAESDGLPRASTKLPNESKSDSNGSERAASVTKDESAKASDLAESEADPQLTERKPRKRKARKRSKHKTLRASGIDTDGASGEEASKSTKRKPKKKNSKSRRATRKGSKKATMRGVGVGDLLSKANFEATGLKRGVGGHTVAASLGDGYGRRGTARDGVGGRRRASKQSKIDDMMNEVVGYIDENGEIDEETDGQKFMYFGDLHDVFKNELLSGVLLKAKRKRRVFYPGDSLFKGVHNNIKIFLV